MQECIFIRSIDIHYVFLFVVLTASVHDCHTKHHSLITAQSGYLSSMVATKTSAGTASCPWRIQTPLGQKVNVTLLNFVMSTTSPVWSSPPEGAGGTGGGRIPTKTPLELCYDVAAIRDETTKRSVTACSSEPRMRSVYLSTGSQIEIEFAVRNLMAQQASPPSVQFLILFEGEESKMRRSLLLVDIFQKSKA